MDTVAKFDVVETTIAQVHEAFASGRLTARQLVQTYLARIAAYDKAGPRINAIISTNPKALEEADALDAAYAKGGLTGPLHGIPLVMKDQGDVKDMPTTMGSVLFKDHYPDRDAYAVGLLKKAGAIFIGKSTLGELGAGDTHGSLFGSTRNVYDLERTAGGSSGGSGAAVSANFCAVAIGQEGYASIRRPSTWNGVAGMRPTAGLVSRTGVYGGWPSIIGSLGPMARTVEDLARVLDCMVGYDAQDPVTAMGHGRAPQSYCAGLDSRALKGARIGVLRESMGHNSDPASEDFAKVTAVFDSAVADLENAGAVVVDPIVIPDLKALLAQRSRADKDDYDSFAAYVAGSANAPFATREEAMASPLYAETSRGAQQRWKQTNTREQHYDYLRARDQLMLNLHNVMAFHKLDAIVHKAVEHQPTLIRDGVNPPYVDQWGAPHINTFLTYVPSIVVPSGLTSDGLPAGIAFLGLPYTDARMIQLAYGYEQATKKRVPPPLVA
ncbi:MAG: Amidase [Hyphomicrobiales bacterium]|nr:Amidase [Hyphomicrobiales bacterium]